MENNDKGKGNSKNQTSSSSNDRSSTLASSQSQGAGNNINQNNQNQNNQQPPPPLPQLVQIQVQPVPVRQRQAKKSPSKPGTGRGGRGEGKRPKICEVCGDVAKSFHFGGLTCDSCKAFFRRSVQGRNYANFNCPLKHVCDITKITRKICQLCRFKKCLTIGMEKNWVMTDDERKALAMARLERKNRGSRTEEEERERERMAREERREWERRERNEREIRERERERREYVPRVNEMLRYMAPIEQFEIEFVMINYEKAFRAVPYECEISADNRSSVDIIQMFTTILKRFTAFSKMFYEFQSLAPLDQGVLLRYAVLEMCLLRSAVAFDPHQMIWPNTNANFLRNCPQLRLDQMAKLVSTELYEMHVRFIKGMQELKADEPSTMMLALIVLFNPERNYLTYEAIDNMTIAQDKYLELLRKYLNWKYGPQGPRMYPKFLSKLTDLRQLNDFHTEYNLRLDKIDVEVIREQLGNINLNPYPQWDLLKNPLKKPSLPDEAGMWMQFDKLVEAHKQNDPPMFHPNPPHRVPSHAEKYGQNLPPGRSTHPGTGRIQRIIEQHQQFISMAGNVVLSSAEGIQIQPRIAMQPPPLSASGRNTQQQQQEQQQQPQQQEPQHYQQQQSQTSQQQHVFVEPPYRHITQWPQKRLPSQQQQPQLQQQPELQQQPQQQSPISALEKFDEEFLGVAKCQPPPSTTIDVNFPMETSLEFEHLNVPTAVPYLGEEPIPGPSTYNPYYYNPQQQEEPEITIIPTPTPINQGTVTLFDKIKMKLGVGKRGSRGNNKSKETGGQSQKQPSAPASASVGSYSAAQEKLHMKLLHEQQRQIQEQQRFFYQFQKHQMQQQQPPPTIDQFPTIQHHLTSSTSSPQLQNPSTSPLTLGARRTPISSTEMLPTTQMHQQQRASVIQSISYPQLGRSPIIQQYHQHQQQLTQEESTHEQAQHQEKGGN